MIRSMSWNWRRWIDRQSISLNFGVDGLVGHRSTPCRKITQVHDRDEMTIRATLLLLQLSENTWYSERGRDRDTWGKSGNMLQCVSLSTDPYFPVSDPLSIFGGFLCSSLREFEDCGQDGLWRSDFPTTPDIGQNLVANFLLIRIVRLSASLNQEQNVRI